MTIENQFHPDMAFHPGEVLREKLQEIGMTSNKFAELTKKPERTINAVIKGTSSITPDMAVLFERVTKIPAYFWLDMQQSYDEFIAHKERKSAIIDSANWAKKFPVSEMVNKGWFAPGGTCAEKTKYNAFNDLEYTLSLNEAISNKNQKNRHQKTPKFIVHVRNINNDDEFNDEFYKESSNEEYLIAG